MDLLPFCPRSTERSTPARIHRAPRAPKREEATPKGRLSTHFTGAAALLLLAATATARRRSVSGGRRAGVAGRAGRPHVSGRAGAHRRVRAAVSRRRVAGVSGRATHAATRRGRGRGRPRAAGRVHSTAATGGAGRWAAGRVIAAAGRRRGGAGRAGRVIATAAGRRRGGAGRAGRVVATAARRRRRGAGRRAAGRVHAGTADVTLAGRAGATFGVRAASHPTAGRGTLARVADHRTTGVPAHGPLFTTNDRGCAAEAARRGARRAPPAFVVRRGRPPGARLILRTGAVGDRAAAAVVRVVAVAPGPCPVAAVVDHAIAFPDEARGEVRVAGAARRPVAALPLPV